MIFGRIILDPDKNQLKNGLRRNIMETKTTCGRPAGRKKTSKIEVSLEPEIKEAFMNILHEEGKTASVEIGQWIRAYIKENSEEK